MEAAGDGKGDSRTWWCLLLLHIHDLKNELPWNLDGRLYSFCQLLATGRKNNGYAWGPDSVGLEGELQKRNLCHQMKALAP